jgi:hypothetical protein
MHVTTDPSGLLATLGLAPTPFQPIRARADATAVCSAGHVRPPPNLELASATPVTDERTLLELTSSRPT